MLDVLATVTMLLACCAPPLPVPLAELGIIEVCRDVVVEHPNAPLFPDAFPIDPNTNPSDFAGTMDDGQLLLLPNVNDGVELFMFDVPVLDTLFELVIFVILVNGITLVLEPIDANPEGLCSFFSVTLLKLAARFVRDDAKIVSAVFILSVEDTVKVDEQVPAACEIFVLELLF